jgi:SAM-dependent methyltransferase
MLRLHDRPPEGKIGLLKEIARVLRRGGRLYVVDFDKPENPGEGGMLAFAQLIWGTASVAPHVSGSWVEFFVKVGLAGVRRQSSHSIGIGRLSVVKARKR